MDYGCDRGIGLIIFTTLVTTLTCTSMGVFRFLSSGSSTPYSMDAASVLEIVGKAGGGENHAYFPESLWKKG